MFCTKCGAKNSKDDKFCYKCGSELENNVNADNPKLSTNEKEKDKLPFLKNKKWLFYVNQKKLWNGMTKCGHIQLNYLEV